MCAGAGERRAVAPALVLRRQAAGRSAGGGGGQGDAGLRGAGDRQHGAAAAQLGPGPRGHSSVESFYDRWRHAPPNATVYIIIAVTHSNKYYVYFAIHTRALYSTCHIINENRFARFVRST